MNQVIAVKIKTLEIRMPSFGNASNCSKSHPIIKISSSPLLQPCRKEEQCDCDDEEQLLVVEEKVATTTTTKTT